MNNPESDDLKHDNSEQAHIAHELSFLFGNSIVAQAQLVDAGILNMTDAMTKAVGNGLRQLKQLINDPGAQQRWVSEQAPGLQLLLCLWIIDMELLDKIQICSYW